MIRMRSSLKYVAGYEIDVTRKQIHATGLGAHAPQSVEASRIYRRRNVAGHAAGSYSVNHGNLRYMNSPVLGLCPRGDALAMWRCNRYMTRSCDDWSLSLKCYINCACDLCHWSLAQCRRQLSGEAHKTMSRGRVEGDAPCY